MRTAVVLLFAACLALCAQQVAPLTPRTTVSDTMRDWNGQVLTGTLTVELTASPYLFRTKVAVSAGEFSVSLYPGTYAVSIYSSTFGAARSEVWVVPASESSLDLGDVGSGSADILVGSGAASWGGISGTLSAQTDLASALSGKAAASHAHAESEVTNLTTDLAGKAATSHAHTMFSTAGVGHTWFWGIPDTGVGSYNLTVVSANRVYYHEFTVPATQTIQNLYFNIATPDDGKHIAFGIWNAAGALVTNGNSSTATSGASMAYMAVTFPNGGVVLSPGTYYVAFTSDSTTLAVEHVNNGGGGGSGIVEQFLDGVATLTGVSGLRFNFRDGTSSTGTSTLIMPANMAAASSRIARSSGPPNSMRPLIFGTP